MLIVGLGNPGNGYQFTRHNAGYMIVDRLAQKWNLNFTISKKFDSELSQNRNHFLAKPQLYMNKSGEVVSRLVSYYKIPLSDIIIIHDDLDLKLNEYRLHFAKGPKIHNGVNSIEKALGSKDFFRYRVGIENRPDKSISGKDYVLQPFNSDEKAVIEKTAQEIALEIEKNFDL